MRIAVLSGKGGTGKTFISANLAAAADRAAYIDCDVEEPNGRLFLKPQGCTESEVFTLLPAFDEEKCTGCRKCVDFCKFNALFYVKKKPRVFTEICHSCGGCALVCPEGAVSDEKRRVGIVEQGISENVKVFTGVLDTGEISAVPVIKEVLKEGLDSEELSVIDCPPGSGCSVMESVSEADICILAAEPTAFGFHNFMMVHKLVKILGKPCVVVVNKEDKPYEPLEAFCRENGTKILMRVPYSRELAEYGAAGELPVRRDENYREMFRELLDRVCMEAAK